ncbi:GNAT family N-acetyltransferase [Streptosporangium sp. NPDC001681]|uniref:GNAT family N-acetyltransferase n=1 Tax=Streptosporangium sp. NPDC001681 TaxID=3154395 RepID=UPI003330E008
MSFGTYARRVRNQDLPYGLRYTSLRYAVERYMPVGYNATWDYITGRAGRIRTDETALLRALDILETSRKARLAEMAAFTLRRTTEKRDRRTVSADEHRYRHGWRWPGPDAHEAMHQTVQTLWTQYERLPFPEVPPADKADLAMLDLTVAGCVWTYLRRGGALHPDHRDILRSCLADLRAVRLGYSLSFSEAFTYFLRLRKMAELVAYDALPLVRRAWHGDAERIADVFLAARGQMTYLPRLHTDEETRAWIAGVVVARHETWVAELHGQVAGFAALDDQWLAHLYVAPEAQGHGIGSALLAQTRKVRPGPLNLHVFQQNTGARRFYERHGFTLVALGDGGDNEENLPDAHYRWRASAEPRQPEPAGGLNESLTCAFPLALADDVRTAVGVMPIAGHCPATSFEVTVGEDRVAVPERIYHPEPTSEALSALSPVQRVILHCLYTRHHDGFVRQRHLAQIVGSLEPWVIPYVARLVGEYVVEIVGDVHRMFDDLGRPGSAVHAAYGRFFADNPDFLTVTEQRVISYWSCYHTSAYPRLREYPGYLLVSALRAAASA